mmetsp:Transcript_30021/g.101200  ORF Transcript_30021/g.101200 Transcript_30021/m.101200 type:complete len:231 (-) Transcript_30021:1970-2662(-)
MGPRRALPPRADAAAPAPPRARQGAPRLCAAAELALGGGADAGRAAVHHRGRRRRRRRRRRPRPQDPRPSLQTKRVCRMARPAANRRHVPRRARGLHHRRHARRPRRRRHRRAGHPGRMAARRRRLDFKGDCALGSARGSTHCTSKRRRRAGPGRLRVGHRGLCAGIPAVFGQAAEVHPVGELAADREGTARLAQGRLRGARPPARRGHVRGFAAGAAARRRAALEPDCE